MPSRTTRSSDSPKQEPRRASGRPFADATVGRDTILDATVRLLKSRTPEQLSISEIATEVGVTRTLVRYYFSDLRGLLGEVTELLMSELQDRMGKALKMRGTVTERVHQRLLLRLEFMREHPQFGWPRTPTPRAVRSTSQGAPACRRHWAATSRPARPWPSTPSDRPASAVGTDSKRSRFPSTPCSRDRRCKWVRPAAP